MSCVFAKQKRQRVAKFATLLQCTKKSLMGTRFSGCFLLFGIYGGNRLRLYLQRYLYLSRQAILVEIFFTENV